MEKASSDYQLAYIQNTYPATRTVDQPYILYNTLSGIYEHMFYAAIVFTPTQIKHV